MRLLLVEDDSSLAEGILTSLKGEGYTLDWLQDGASALHALSSEPFDLAILDLGLPRMDGLQVLRALRDRHQAVPVLVLTA
ncbi:MAG: response regulator, partial [Halopseudomonas aestusnigri]|nr:response regulator [Halopseudomonas aestusnigri]